MTMPASPYNRRSATLLLLSSTNTVASITTLLQESLNRDRINVGKICSLKLGPLLFYKLGDSRLCLRTILLEFAVRMICIAANFLFERLLHWQKEFVAEVSVIPRFHSSGRIRQDDNFLELAIWRRTPSLVLGVAYKQTSFFFVLLITTYASNFHLFGRNIVIIQRVWGQSERGRSRMFLLKPTKSSFFFTRCDAFSTLIETVVVTGFTRMLLSDTVSEPDPMIEGCTTALISVLCRSPATTFHPVSFQSPSLQPTYSGSGGFVLSCYGAHLHGVEKCLPGHPSYLRILF